MRHFRQRIVVPATARPPLFPVVGGRRPEGHGRPLPRMQDRILREHVPAPMDDDTLKAVDKLLADAKRHLSAA